MRGPAAPDWPWRRGRPPLDNLSAHRGADIRRWATKRRGGLCFTPTYASWANPIEAHFGPLRQFTSPIRTTPTTRCRPAPWKVPPPWPTGRAARRPVDALAHRRPGRCQPFTGCDGCGGGPGAGPR
ncbi:transposase [Streptomyces albicerus]